MANIETVHERENETSLLLTIETPLRNIAPSQTAAAFRF